MTIVVVVAAPSRAPPSRGGSDLDDSSPTPDNESTLENVRLTAEEALADSHDAHNRPRRRRELILSALRSEFRKDGTAVASFVAPSIPDPDLCAYRLLHTDGLLNFLSTAWDRWVELGESGRDVDCSLPLP
eukprot:CAMPEP_0183313912 /NCGR_PEP_ID=MMETSP0160_2-20130417/46942_1 /TAXON_ID=2839 ORGANISM="Odontella Sinensis, Strain Grunow 1884" /NCGR_SAMPLE_ID=MMETSP0160_2 /ASSEMBLY_ACC=CAM_ASM_000250 /LENGTH=130 /DNA_ID=CAMNT_0025479095 /DNA_START=248 /DNA_END=636 /DNA_ORIENTATION=-